MYPTPADTLSYASEMEAIAVSAKPYIDLKEAAAILGITRQAVHLIVSDEEKRKALLPSAYQTESSLWIMLRSDVERLRKLRENGA